MPRSTRDKANWKMYTLVVPLLQDVLGDYYNENFSVASVREKWDKYIVNKKFLQDVPFINNFCDWDLASQFHLYRINNATNAVQKVTFHLGGKEVGDFVHGRTDWGHSRYENFKNLTFDSACELVAAFSKVNQGLEKYLKELEFIVKVGSTAINCGLPKEVVISSDDTMAEIISQFSTERIRAQLEYGILMSAQRSSSNDVVTHWENVENALELLEFDVIKEEKYKVRVKNVSDMSISLSLWVSNVQLKEKYVIVFPTKQQQVVSNKTVEINPNEEITRNIALKPDVLYHFALFYYWKKDGVITADNDHIIVSTCQ